MNLKNDKFNYAKKYKALCKYLAIALPLLLLLIACIFPTKQINNTYALEETTTTETDTTINFNQLLNIDNYVFSQDGLTLTIRNNRVILNGTAVTSGNFEIYNNLISLINGHTYILSNYFVSMPLSSLNVSIIQLYRQGGPYYGIQENYSNNYTKFTHYSSINTRYYLRFRYENGTTYNLDYYINLFDLTQMGLDNLSSEDFFNLFPLKQYVYNSGIDITLSKLTIVNNVGNDSQAPLQINETKQPNEAILQPLNLLYKANINSWYDTFLTAFELNYEDNNYMYYLVHYPLYILYVVLLDLILDIILLVPCLLHRLVHKYKGDD